MIDVENEVNKHRNIRDRDEMTRRIQDYKNLALQHATNLVIAGQYSAVAHKLQEICDKLPAPNLIKHPTGNKSAPSKTAKITREEQTRINAAWKKRTKS